MKTRFFLIPAMGAAYSALRPTRQRLAITRAYIVEGAPQQPTFDGGVLGNDDRSGRMVGPERWQRR